MPLSLFLGVGVQEAGICQTTLAGSLIASFRGRAKQVGPEGCSTFCIRIYAEDPVTSWVGSGTQLPPSAGATDTVCGHQVEMAKVR